jgi:hypothetical protein
MNKVAIDVFLNFDGLKKKDSPNIEHIKQFFLKSANKIKQKIIKTNAKRLINN